MYTTTASSDIVCVNSHMSFLVSGPLCYIMYVMKTDHVFGIRVDS